MPGRHLMRGHTAGRKGLKRVFSSNRTLRTTLGPKARKEALSTLKGFKSGGGITQKELKKSYRKWAGDTSDNITRAQAKVIRRELNEYANQSEQVKKEDTRDYLDQVRSGPRPGSIAVSNDTRAYLNKTKDRRSGHIKPEASSDFFRDSSTDLPNSFDDEASNSSIEREQLF